MLRDIN